MDGMNGDAMVILQETGWVEETGGWIPSILAVRGVYC